MRVMVTGANGFIGKNLLVHFHEKSGFDVVPFTRENSLKDLPDLLKDVDWVVHLAGINRPEDPLEFKTVNEGLTAALCEAVADTGRHIPLIYSSSIQAEINNQYGNSKRCAEEVLMDLNKRTGNPVHIYRLPNVFGKWAKPNYNSAVATFCHNIARDLSVTVHDTEAVINLVYVDDVVASFISLMDRDMGTGPYISINPSYQITVGALVEQLNRFKASRENLVTEQVGSGLIRALYSTYVSYLPQNSFTYKIPQHSDERGTFVEILKTADSGQFSFFTAYPGVTRGGHYHHSKTEKFLVIKGHACFRFRHMLTGEYYELLTSGDSPEIVETVPGWAHDITNIGDDELVCMLWANEIFDRENPDTYACPVGNKD